MRRSCIRLGSGRVTVIYPQAFDPWLEGLMEPADESPVLDRWVRLCANEEAGCFDVLSSIDRPKLKLGPGEALAFLWERVSFLLVDDLRDAIALHAAGLRHGNGLVLLPGRTGAGKSWLSLWYRARGFDLCTDEIVTTSIVTDGSGDPVLEGALGRPVFLKAVDDPQALLRPGEAPVAQQESPFGLLLRLDNGAPATSGPIGRGLIVLPCFSPGASFKLTALTTGEACLRLMESCLNARNLPRGGLPFASALARRMPAVALDYGEAGQLDGTLDVLTRQALAGPISPDDLAAMCAAFTAAAAARTGSASSDAVARSSTSPPKRDVPAPTVARFARRLTVGMATYDDYDGVYFTIQSLRMHNPELVRDTEFVVIDNNPGGIASEALSHLGKSIDGYRYVPRGEWSGTAIRNAVFEEASSPLVLCVDSHVLIAPGAVSKLIAYFEADPGMRDLLQGPLIYDDLQRTSTHMEPQWRAGMYGTWATDPRGADPSAPGFEIPMQGLGVFACRRAAWPGFNPQFRGFGAEEGYIHEKVRQRGGRTLCLPFLQWLHRFSRPSGPPYVNRWEDRIRNYVIGFTELGLDTAEMEAHFAEVLGAETAARIFSNIKQELAIR